MQKTKKRLNEEQFREISKEAIPHIEALQGILKREELGNLANLTFAGDGYMTFGIYDSGWELSRIDSEASFKMIHEIGFEEE